ETTPSSFTPTTSSCGDNFSSSSFLAGGTTTSLSGVWVSSLIFSSSATSSGAPSAVDSPTLSSAVDSSSLTSSANSLGHCSFSSTPSTIFSSLATCCISMSSCVLL